MQCFIFYVRTFNLTMRMVLKNNRKYSGTKGQPERSGDPHECVRHDTKGQPERSGDPVHESARHGVSENI